MEMNFFKTWLPLMDATKDPDDDPFAKLCDQIFNEIYWDGAEGKKEFEKELAKIKDPEVRKSVKGAAETLQEMIKYFYITVGLALAQDYDVTTSMAREQVDYLREKIHDSRVFPITARLKKIPGPEEISTPEKSQGKNKGMVLGSEYLTAKELAKNLEVSQSWVLRKAKCGIIPSIRIGGLIRFSGKDVKAWILGHATKGALKI
jgi:excisionase family DNA binding protein